MTGDQGEAYRGAGDQREEDGGGDGATEEEPQARTSLLPAGRVFVRFFVPVEDVSRIKAGDVVDISCTGCAAGMQGRVRFVSRESEFTPPVIFSESAHQRMVFMIEAAPLDGADLRPGVPVTVRLASKPKSA